MIENAQDIFGPQDIDSAEECAYSETGFSLRHSADKKIGPSDSLEIRHDAGAMAAGHKNLEPTKVNKYLVCYETCLVVVNEIDYCAITFMVLL
jgi:hypothetical protein